jgi:hypothetical protein
MEPKPGGHFSYAKTKYDSIYDSIICKWEKRQNCTGKIQMEVTAHSNCMAAMYAQWEKYSIQAGKHTFNCKPEKQTSVTNVPLNKTGKARNDFSCFERNVEVMKSLYFKRHRYGISSASLKTMNYANLNKDERTV